MKVNKHNLPMVGLREASGETKYLNRNNGCYIQISYDTSDGKILTDYHSSFGQNSWTEYHDPNIMKICNTSKPMTMQEIADRIADFIQIAN